MQNFKVKLTESRFPKLLSDLQFNNQFLKILSLSLVVVTSLSTGLNFYLIKKEPVILTLSQNAKELQKSKPPKIEDMIKESIQKYVEKRYGWDPETIPKKLKDAESFILPKTIKVFQKEISNIIKFSNEKQVSQKLYIDKIDVNSTKKEVLILGSRITTIQGLKAVGNLKLLLSYELGERTEFNPWGVYVVKESEE